MHASASQSAILKKMASRVEVWVNRPNQLEVMYTNMAADLEGKIYVKLVRKEADLEKQIMKVPLFNKCCPQINARFN